jgi:hypothetical protein
MDKFIQLDLEEKSKRVGVKMSQKEYEVLLKLKLETGLPISQVLRRCFFKLYSNRFEE